MVSFLLLNNLRIWFILGWLGFGPIIALLVGSLVVSFIFSHDDY